MYICKECEINEVPEGRVRLGYSNCLTCGEAAAQVEVNRKRTRVAIAFPKGAYQYIPDNYNLGDLG